MCGVNDRCWYVAIRDGQMALQKSIQTDFSDVPEGGYQKVVAFSPKGSKCVTGGTDGHVMAFCLTTISNRVGELLVLSGLEEEIRSLSQGPR